MKIYDYIRIDMSTEQVLEESSCDYNGPIAECKGGGGGGGDQVDREYNARMASIAEEQEAMAREMYGTYKHGLRGRGPSERQLEAQQIRANYNLVPYEQSQAREQARLGREQAATARELLPSQKTRALAESALATKQARAREELVPKQQRATSRFYNEAMSGVDTQERVNQAAADVGQAFSGAEEQTRRALGGMGLDPGSERGRSEFSRAGLNYGRALSGARTQARERAEDEEFRRLGAAAGRGGGGGAIQ